MSDIVRVAAVRGTDDDAEVIPEKPLILGVVAPSGGGKTTVCRHLEAAHGFLRVHVAYSVHRAFLAMFGVGPEYLRMPLIERPASFLGGVTPRLFLEQLGTKVHDIAPAATPGAALNIVSRIIDDNPGARIIVDGLRRTTEAKMVRLLGGHVLRIDGHAIDEAKPCDISQRDIVADYTLHFSADLDALHFEIDRIIAELTFRRRWKLDDCQNERLVPRRA